MFAFSDGDSGEIGTQQVDVVLVSEWARLSPTLDTHTSLWFGRSASVAIEGWLDGSMALSGPVHAAVHTIHVVMKGFLPRSETSSGCDDVHWGRSCAMSCHISLINHV